MKEWYTAQDLASENLPGLPRTDRRIRARAETEGWKSREREFGKGLEYHYTALPLDAQAVLLKAESRAVLAAELPQALMVPKPTLPALPPDPALKAAGDAQAAHLTGDALARINAKVGILSAFQRFVAEHPAQGRQRPGGTQHKEAFAAG